MKLFLGAMARNENRYLDEWVRHYRSKGIDHIVIYDNNDDIGEKLTDVTMVRLGIDEGWLEVRDLRGVREPLLQNRIYTQLYNEFKDDYDWLMMLDIDEYLSNCSMDSLKKTLSDPRYDGFDVIHVNWRLYTDGNSSRRSDYEKHASLPLTKRFTRPLSDLFPERNCLNRECKSIVRGHLDNVRYRTAHTIEGHRRCCNPIGKSVPCEASCVKDVIDHTLVIRHYITKTLQEYCDNKLPLADGMFHSKTRIDINFFFVYNSINKFKLDYLDRRFGKGASEKVNEEIIQNKITTMMREFDRQTLSINDEAATAWLKKKKEMKQQMYGKKR